ncbi:MAG: hypothetical protein ACRDIY_16745 [Chloroflexota bacterium]
MRSASACRLVVRTERTIRSQAPSLRDGRLDPASGARRVLPVCPGLRPAGRHDSTILLRSQIADVGVPLLLLVHIPTFFRRASLQSTHEDLDLAAR